MPSALHDVEDLGQRGAGWIDRDAPVLGPVALMRYSSAVATIQVREVPEEAYEVLRRRARRAGQSIQAYMRDQVVALAARPTKEEAVESIETILRSIDAAEPSPQAIAEDLAAERR